MTDEIIINNDDNSKSTKKIRRPTKTDEDTKAMLHDIFNGKPFKYPKPYLISSNGQYIWADFVWRDDETDGLMAAIKTHDDGVIAVELCNIDYVMHMTPSYEMEDVQIQKMDDLDNRMFI
jgi:hypothetical protein